MQQIIPPGKVWVEVHGLYYDDLYEVDLTTPEEEIAEARRQYREAYKHKAVVISVTRILPKTEG